MKEILKQKIQECDMLLIGIGEEFEVKERLNQNQSYLHIMRQIAENESIQWIIPYVNYLFIKQMGILNNAISNIKNIVQDKNFFIVTTCMNGIFNEEDILKERVVSPCGGFHLMQSKKDIKKEIVQTPVQVLQQIEDFVNGKEQMSDLQEQLDKMDMVFNNLYAEKYDEAGYLDSWGIYTKWLQGTLNRRVCVVELGVLMDYPSVIRWPFEKISYLNQKADFLE